MKALCKKWKSSRGASILLALLFLLICIMAGASVLMAAASNAGKVRSNREEQQSYLTLSSALTLICDELERVEYVGRYSWEVRAVYIPVTDGEGNLTDEFDHNEHTYTQLPGELRGVGDGWSQAGGEWELSGVVPLNDNLDAVFAENFRRGALLGEANPRDGFIFHPMKAEGAKPKDPYTVTLEAGESDPACGEEIRKPVVVSVDLRPSGRIVLTAAFETDSGYVMQALLEPVLEPGKTLKDVIAPSVPPKRSDPGAADGEYETDEGLRWSLSRITRKEATGG